MKKLQQGDRYSKDVRFTQAQVNIFAEVTGDFNPVHIDADYAATTMFGKPIVHGFLTGAVFSKVFGTEFPGEGTIYLYQDMSFLAPVFVENDYVAHFEIVEVNAEKHRILVNCSLNDSNDKQVVLGKAKLMNINKI
jgi:acyl dehydratase